MQSIRLRIYTFARLMINGKYKYLYGCMRRRFIFYFAKKKGGYLNNQLSRRKGKCSLCGYCCKITMPWCPYLENGKCSIYDKQPFFCKVFPIDEKDKELNDVKELCGYYFE